MNIHENVGVPFCYRLRSFVVRDNFVSDSFIFIRSVEKIRCN